jgi:hypothetical protein
VVLARMVARSEEDGGRLLMASSSGVERRPVRWLRGSSAQGRAVSGR